MKFCSSAFVLGWGALVALSPPLYAKPRLETQVEVGKVSKDVKVANRPSLAKRVGERIRFTMWAEGLPRPKYSNQMLDTSPYKPFGTLRMDGGVWWSIVKPPRGQENNTLNHRAGQRIEISSDTVHNGGHDFVADVGYNEKQWRDFKLSLTLYDFAPTYLAGNGASRERMDEIQRMNDYNYANPPVMGRYERSLDLSKLRKGDYVWAWTDGKREGSKLHWRIEHIGYLYAVDYPRLDPGIKKPKITDRIPQPGPVSKITKPRVGGPLIKQRTQR